MVKFILTSVVVFLLSHCYGQNEIFIKSNVAIQGYDPVAYFKKAIPIRGVADYSFKWKDALWYFSNAANLTEFQRNPEAYAPQYGGYCAYGMAGGHKVATSPDAWTVLDGKLYLNYNKSVQSLWSQDKAGNIDRANRHWSAIKNKKSNGQM